MGQGANTAIIDAAALGTLFADVPDASAAQISRRLRVYDEVRVPRVSATQLWSEVPVFAQPQRKNDEVRAFLPDVELPGEFSALPPYPLPPTPSLPSSAPSTTQPVPSISSRSHGS